jgi:hypothetical protein
VRHRPYAAAALLVLLVTTACATSAPAGQNVKRPANVASGPEVLDPAPTGVVEDTPKWTELPQPISAVFGDALLKGRFQAFAAMTESTVAVRLKAAPAEKDIYRALSAAEAFTPSDYSILLNVYAPGPDGKDRYAGYEWTPRSGLLVRKASADAKQSWDDAITAITQGSAAGVTPDEVQRIASGETSPPLFQ